MSCIHIRESLMWLPSVTNSIHESSQFRSYGSNESHANSYCLTVRSQHRYSSSQPAKLSFVLCLPATARACVPSRRRVGLTRLATETGFWGLFLRISAPFSSLEASSSLVLRLLWFSCAGRAGQARDAVSEAYERPGALCHCRGQAGHADRRALVRDGMCADLAGAAPAEPLPALPPGRPLEPLAHGLAHAGRRERV